MTTPEQIYRFLDDIGIAYTVAEHPPTPTAADALRYARADEGTHCKNILLRDHKGTHHYLVVCDCRHSIDMEALQRQLGRGRLSFASAARLMRLLGVQAGSVSPLGLVADTGHAVELIMDERLQESDRLSFHPNDCRLSLTLTREDFAKFVLATGRTPLWKKLY